MRKLFLLIVVISFVSVSTYANALGPIEPPTDFDNVDIDGSDEPRAPIEPPTDFDNVDIEGSVEPGVPIEPPTDFDNVNVDESVE